MTEFILKLASNLVFGIERRNGQIIIDIKFRRALYLSEIRIEVSSNIVQYCGAPPQLLSDKLKSIHKRAIKKIASEGSISYSPGQ